MDVRGVAEEERAGVAKATRDAVMHMVRRKPVDPIDRDAHPFDNGLTDVIPADVAAVLGTRPHGSNQSRTPGRFQRENREEVRPVERNVQLVIHHRPACLDVRHVEHVRVGSAGKIRAEDLAHFRVRAVAAGNIRGFTRSFAAIGHT